jgi:predicted small secreted protein
MLQKLVLVFACLSVLMLAGCSTVQGLGEDIQKGGKVIEKAAK